MASLSLVFKACGYGTKKQQMAFFQLLACCHAVDAVATPVYPLLPNHAPKDTLERLKKIFFSTSQI